MQRGHCRSFAAVLLCGGDAPPARKCGGGAQPELPSRVELTLHSRWQNRSSVPPVSHLRGRVEQS